MQRAEDVGYEDHGERGIAQDRGVGCAADNESSRATARRVANEFVAVGVLAGQCEKRIAALNLARVDRGATDGRFSFMQGFTTDSGRQ
jgi:hypothetical protein